MEVIAKLKQGYHFFGPPCISLQVEYENLRFSTTESPYLGNGAEPQLLLNVNRKSRVLYQTTWSPMTLSDLGG